MVWSPLDNLIPARLKSGRVSAGYKRMDVLAKLLDVSARTYSKWESGKSKPNIDQFNQLQKILKKSADFFYISSWVDEKKVKLPTDYRIGLKSLIRSWDPKMVVWDPTMYSLIKEAAVHQSKAEHLVEEVCSWSEINGLDSVIKIKDPEKLYSRIRDFLNIAYKKNHKKNPTYKQFLEYFIDQIESFNNVFVPRFIGAFQLSWNSKDKAFIEPHRFTCLTRKSKLAPLIMINGLATHKNQLISVIQGLIHLAENKPGITHQAFLGEAQTQKQEDGYRIYTLARDMLDDYAGLRETSVDYREKELPYKLSIYPGRLFLRYLDCLDSVRPTGVYEKEAQRLLNAGVVNIEKALK